MITVIIPALNEAATIENVIQKALSGKNVNQVLVVDDKSIDNTIELARKAGAEVITSTRLGKGASMLDGLMLAKNDIVAYIDADIPTYPDNIIDILTEPLINQQADFVKSHFNRQAGRVTELVAKPLLSILFPALAVYEQPLSGIIAGRKNFLQNINFENDYGVDIGLLIDMHLSGARIADVNIGLVENKMKPWQALGQMSKEVTRAILKRAKQVPDHNLETLEDISIIREQMDYAINESKRNLKKMIIFDMDNTILRKSFIHTAAVAFGFKQQLVDIITANYHPLIRTKKIAMLLKGQSFAEILKVADSIPVVEDFGEVVDELKRRGYVTGIVSDSYDCITNHLKNRFGLDFTIANELEFNQSICTGEVKIPSHFLKCESSISNLDYCKSNILLKMAEQYGIDIKNIIVIGDGENDFHSIKAAGIGVSFCSNYEYLDVVADMVIKEPSFKKLLEVA